MAEEIGELDLTAQADAAKSATNYITEDVSNGIKVHNASDVTTFIQIISTAIDFVRAGLSYLKIWVDSNVAKVRVGLESAGHSVFSPNGMEVFSDESTSIASFGSNGAQIGESSSDHIVLDTTGLHVYKGDGTSGNVNDVDLNGLSLDVTQVIDGLTQSSHFIQTADGFTFMIDDTINAKQDAGDYATADDLAGAVTSINEDISTKVNAAEMTEALGGAQDYAEELAEGAQADAEATASALASDAAKTATNFITVINGGGILVHRNNSHDSETGEDNGNSETGEDNNGSETEEISVDGVRISDTVEIVRNNESVAEFGETFRIGLTNQTHMEGRASRLAFARGGNDLAWFGQEDENDSDSPWGLHTEMLYVEDMQRFGHFAWIKRSNNNMTLKWLESGE